MSYILEEQIKGPSGTWIWFRTEFKTKESAEAVGVARKLKGISKYYDIYHS